MNRRQPDDFPEIRRATAGFHEVLCAWNPGCRPVPLTADLRYDSADPYAVCLSLHPDGYSTVDWVFARDLLADGIHHQVGLGDVVVEPVRARRADYVRITLRSPTTQFHAQLPARAVASFLRRTHAIVRLGTEERHLDLDNVVRRLSSETG